MMVMHDVFPSRGIDLFNFFVGNSAILRRKCMPLKLYLTMYVFGVNNTLIVQRKYLFTCQIPCSCIQRTFQRKHIFLRIPNASTLKNYTNSKFLMITASGTEAVIMKNLVSRALATVAVMCLWLQKCYQWFEKQYETPSSKTVELVERITNLLF